MFLGCAGSGLGMRTGILMVGRSVWSQDPVLAVLLASPNRDKGASSILSYLLNPPLVGLLRLRELRMAGWMAVVEPPTPPWHSPGCTSERKETVAGTHTSKRKKHLSCTHSCHLCLVTGRTPTHGGPNHRREGMLELPTFLRMAWEMGQEAPLSISKGW